MRFPEKSTRCIIPYMYAMDTSPESRQVLAELYRKMAPEVKFRRVFDAYETGKVLALAGLRERHPGASEKRIWHLWAKQHLGDELFKEAYGALPDG